MTAFEWFAIAALMRIGSKINTGWPLLEVLFFYVPAGVGIYKLAIGH